MTKFNDTTKKCVLNAVTTAKLLGIESIVIDSNSLRGEFKDNGVFLLQKVDIDTLSFDSLGISRIATFKSRLDLFDGAGDITSELKTKANGDEFIYKLKIKSGRTSIEFKCADPSTIKAPKAFNDPNFFTIGIDSSTVKLLMRSVSAMSSNTITFMSTDDNEVFVKVADSEGDILEHKIPSSVEVLEPEQKTKFSSSFNFKTILPIIKEALRDDDVVALNITKRGVMNFLVNDIGVYVFPEL